MAPPKNTPTLDGYPLKKSPRPDLSKVRGDLSKNPTLGGTPDVAVAPRGKSPLERAIGSGIPVWGQPTPPHTTYTRTKAQYQPYGPEAYGRGSDALKRALLEDAEAKGAAALAAVAEARMNPMRREEIAADAEANRMEIESSMERTFAELAKIDREASEKIDPQRHWKTEGVGSKMEAFAAAGLYALGQSISGMGGGNPILDNINKMISNDLSAQRADLANLSSRAAGKRNLLGFYRQMLGDEDAAEAMAYKRLAADAADKMRGMAASSKISALRAATQITAMKLDKASMDAANAAALKMQDKVVIRSPYKESAATIGAPQLGGPVAAPFQAPQGGVVVAGQADAADQEDPAQGYSPLNEARAESLLRELNGDRGKLLSPAEGVARLIDRRSVVEPYTKQQMDYLTKLSQMPEWPPGTSPDYPFGGAPPKAPSIPGARGTAPGTAPGMIPVTAPGTAPGMIPVTGVDEPGVDEPGIELGLPPAPGAPVGVPPGVLAPQGQPPLATPPGAPLVAPGTAVPGVPGPPAPLTQPAPGVVPPLAGAAGGLPGGEAPSPEQGGPVFPGEPGYIEEPTTPEQAALAAAKTKAASGKKLTPVEAGLVAGEKAARDAIQSEGPAKGGLEVPPADLVAKARQKQAEGKPLMPWDRAALAAAPPPEGTVDPQTGLSAAEKNRALAKAAAEKRARDAKAAADEEKFIRTAYDIQKQRAADAAAEAAAEAAAKAAAKAAAAKAAADKAAQDKADAEARAASDEAQRRRDAEIQRKNDLIDARTAAALSSDPQYTVARAVRESQFKSPPLIDASKGKTFAIREAMRKYNTQTLKVKAYDKKLELYRKDPEKYPDPGERPQSDKNYVALMRREAQEKKAEEVARKKLVTQPRGGKMSDLFKAQLEWEKRQGDEAKKLALAQKVRADKLAKESRALNEKIPTPAISSIMAGSTLMARWNQNVAASQGLPPAPGVNPRVHMLRVLAEGRGSGGIGGVVKKFGVDVKSVLRMEGGKETKFPSEDLTALRVQLRTGAAFSKSEHAVQKGGVPDVGDSRATSAKLSLNELGIIKDIFEGHKRAYGNSKYGPEIDKVLSDVNWNIRFYTSMLRGLKKMSPKARR